MASYGTKEYRREMRAIHEAVVRSGEAATVTRDGRPWVRVTPADAASTLERLQQEGRVSLPARPRVAIEPIDAGGEDSTGVIGDARR
jgi:antitoxin (DNA-binding transcriptional repressor) of toxin-antitoxin stability system